MMRKRIERGGALLLGFAVVLSAMILPEVYAAEAVDTQRECSITFSVSSTDYAEELAGAQIPVDLYKVASIDVSGNYTAEGSFAELDLSFTENDDTAAAVWEERAADAVGMIGDTAPTAEVSVVNGTAEADGLAAGMYLVVAEETSTDYYNYSFAPYLISLPDNDYYDGGSDAWIYDVQVGLKPEQTERYGSLQINKTLVGQNITMGDKATFVFQIDIRTPKGETDQKLASIDFIGGAASGSAVVDEIPAGSQVTVTEIYSGAAYELTASEGNAVITADETVSTSFTNEHNGSWNGGYGVVNNYSPDENGQYVWTSSAAEN